MDIVSSNFIPGDPRLIDQIVYELKSQGIFDQFRKECIADVDTKPAYQNLSQRVEGSVMNFLNQQKFSIDINKNQLREQLRKNISESGFLDSGVERIVDQVVNPKISTVFLPKVEDVVYRFLGIERPNQEDRRQEVKPKVEDLLPNDLEAVSPESVHDQSANSSLEQKNEAVEANDNSFNSNSNTKTEDESPPFEPLEENTKFSTHEENSVDSNLSGISGLASHDSIQSNDMQLSIQMDISQDFTQNSLNSDGNLSTIVSEEDTKMEICEDSPMAQAKDECENNELIRENSPAKDTTEATDSSKIHRKDIIEEKSADKINLSDNVNEPNSELDINAKKTEEKKEIVKNDAKRTHDKYRSSKSDKDRKEDKDKRTRNKSETKHKDKSNSRQSSSKDNEKEKKEYTNGKGEERENKILKKEDKERNKSKDKSSSKTKDSKSDKNRERSEKSRDKSDKEKDRLEKDKNKDRDRSNKERGDNEKAKPDKDKEKSEIDKPKSNRDKSGKSRSEKEKRDRDKSASGKHTREKSSSSKKGKEKEKHEDKSSKDKNSSSKDKTISINKHKESSSKDKESSKSSKDRDKSKSTTSSKDKEKEKDKDKKEDIIKSKFSDKHRKSEKDKSLSKDKSSSSSRKEKDKKVTDDHYSLKDKKNERRSTDRDSNDGSSRNNSFTETFSSSCKGSSKDSSEVFSSGGGDSSNSDKMEQKPLDSSEKPTGVDLHNVEALSPIKYIKPKFASNIHEAMKLMRIRKQLAKLERQNQLALTHVPVANVNGVELDVKQNDIETREKHNQGINSSITSEQMNPISCLPKNSGKKMAELQVRLERYIETNTCVDEDIPVLKSQDLSMETFEALEARLAQEMSNINDHMYGDEDDNYEYSSIIISPVKKRKLLEESKVSLGNVETLNNEETLKHNQESCEKLVSGSHLHPEDAVCESSFVSTEAICKEELSDPKDSKENINETVEKQLGLTSKDNAAAISTEQNEYVRTEVIEENITENNSDTKCEEIAVKSDEQVVAIAQEVVTEEEKVPELVIDKANIVEEVVDTVQEVVTEKEKVPELVIGKANISEEVMDTVQEVVTKKENVAELVIDKANIIEEVVDTVQEVVSEKEQIPDKATNIAEEEPDSFRKRAVQELLKEFDEFDNEFRGFTFAARNNSSLNNIKQIVENLSRVIEREEGQSPFPLAADPSKVQKEQSKLNQGEDVIARQDMSMFSSCSMKEKQKDLPQKNGKTLFVQIDKLNSDVTPKVLVTLQDMGFKDVENQTGDISAVKEDTFNGARKIKKFVVCNEEVDIRQNGQVIRRESSEDKILAANPSKIINKLETDGCFVFNEEAPCYYFDKADTVSDDHLIILNETIAKLEKSIEEQSLKIQNNIPKPKKRGRKRKAHSTENNNSIGCEYKQERKRRLLSDANSQHSDSLCNTDVSSHQSFSLPLSPAESDKSGEIKKEEPITVKTKRTGRGSTAKRYSSDELYKPRPILSCTSSRRRGTRLSSSRS